MNTSNTAALNTKETLQTRNVSSSTGESPTILTEIYNDNINMAVWERKLSTVMLETIDHITENNPDLQYSTVTTPKTTASLLNKVLKVKTENEKIFTNDVNELVNMFCCLFDLQEVGLRLITLNAAMCPRFHVDRVPCRLITTYKGTGTQWLEHGSVDRTKLGKFNRHQSDKETGLFNSTNKIKQMNQGDIALLKGEMWEGNEGAGLVHRSPQLSNNTSRLILTLDFTAK